MMDSKKSNRIIIIGAGPTGLGAAYRLEELGYDNWGIYERNDHVGGLAASFKDNAGFTWDIGGHVIFSHYEYFDRIIEEALGTEYYSHLRESWIWMLNCWIPYPFQNNIRYLPMEALEECLVGLRNLRNAQPKISSNFHEWIQNTFGSGISKYFMTPYNSKVWGVPLEQMDKNWIAERVSVVNIERIEKNIREQKDDASWGPNNKFKFPKFGGTGVIFEKMAEKFRDRIIFNSSLVSVDIRNKVVTFNDGRRESYDIVINTSPLDKFVSSLTPKNETIANAANDLIHNGGLIVGIGLKRKDDSNKCWMYFPQSDSPFYRVTNFFRYSPFNVPNGDVDNYFSLMCETAYSDHKEVNKGKIVAETIAGLINSKMITDEDKSLIVSEHLIDIDYSYPIPTIKRDNALRTILPYLEDNHIYSRGRFGFWKYEVGNMDHSVMQGVELVDRLLQGKEEKTAIL